MARFFTRTAAWAFAVVLAVILLCCLPALAADVGWWLLAAPAFLALALLLWHGLRRLPDAACRRALAVSLGLWWSCLLGLGWLLRLDPQWDFGAVYHGALQLAAEGHFTSYAPYFLESLNNLFVTLVLTIAFKAGSLAGLSPDFTGILLNSLAVACSVLFLYLAVAKQYCQQLALYFAFLCYFFVPMVLYVPVYYTDTLSMPFVCFGLWAAIMARAAATPHARLLWAGALGLSAGTGYLVKGSAAILLAACLLWALLADHAPMKQTLASCAVALACFAVLVLAWQAFLPVNPWLSLDALDDHRLPASHYIMMGLAGEGGYHGKDHLFSASFGSLPERVAANREVIAQRLQAMGPGGLAAHLQKKLAYTWADGTYFAPMKLCMYPWNEFWLHQWILPGGRHYAVFRRLCGAAQLVLLGLLAGGALRVAMQKQPAANLAFAARAAVVGLALFLMVWETRSRYLVNFAPLLALLAACSLQQLYAWLQTRRKAHKNSV